jgi:CheY-like chemotaxis protein
VPIVALTANAYAEDRENCLSAGMNGYVVKPIRREELLSAIQQAMEETA